MGFGVKVLGFLLAFEKLEEESAVRKAMGFGFGVVGQRELRKIDENEGKLMKGKLNLKLQVARR